MKRATTLKENYEFRRVYRKGKSGVSPLLVVYALPGRAGRNRLGVTVSAKLGQSTACPSRSCGGGMTSCSWRAVAPWTRRTAT